MIKKNRTQYLVIIICSYFQLFFFTSCSQSKIIDIDSLPRDTIGFSDLPVEIQEIFIPYIGFSMKHFSARETLFDSSLFNLTHFDIKDSIDITKGTHNYIFHIFSGPPRRFFFINNKTFCIFRNSPDPIVFVDYFIIYPTDYLENFFNAEESKYIVINIRKYLEE